METNLQSKLPPMLTSYLEYKQNYPDCIIFFQVGDFYEVFFDHAQTVSSVLNLTLTSRDKSAEKPIPMCGVPISVIDNYCARLVNAGYSVAIISQEAVTNNTKGTVPRKLERIITPGIRFLQTNELSEIDEPIVASLYINSERDISIAYSNVQSTKVHVRENLSAEELIFELKRINPNEIVLPKIFSTEHGKQTLDRRSTIVKRLQSELNVNLRFRNEDLVKRSDFGHLAGFSVLSPAAKNALRLLAYYIDETTVGKSPLITEIVQTDLSKFVSIDSTTRSNLELVKNSRDATLRGTLLEAVNYTKSLGGARKLKNWILNPLTDLNLINARQSAVAVFLQNTLQRSELVELLGYISDFERLAVRVELKVVLPRELATLRDSLLRLPDLKNILKVFENEHLSKLVAALPDLNDLLAQLQNTLSDLPPQSLQEGGIIKDGVDAELDQLRNIKSNGKTWIAEMEAQEKERTGISSLKIKYNRVFGYYIEITNANIAKVPAEYIRKQTTVNGERYITEQLKIREDQVLGAEEKQFVLERKIYEELRQTISTYAAKIRQSGDILSEIDVLAGFAQYAESENLIAPLLENSKTLILEEARHPVLVKLLQSDFVANSICLEDRTCLLVTGPNMGGKSTYLRQVALIVILAQIGSYVPAKFAKIGIVDKIFARIGASDNALEGESTFMVEMKEAAHIVRNASDRSLLLIDEIGRGTATTDGLAIAQAILEWILVRIEARTLFATHFHELTELEKTFVSLKNVSVSSVESDGGVVFTHKIIDGAASRSYGIEVATLAGLPDILIKRSRELLKRIDEKKQERKSLASETDFRQLSLFAEEVSIPADYNQLKSLKDELEKISIDQLTPLAALNVLHQLKAANS